MDSILLFVTSIGGLFTLLSYYLLSKNIDDRQYEQIKAGLDFRWWIPSMIVSVISYVYTLLFWVYLKDSELMVFDEPYNDTENNTVRDCIVLMYSIFLFSAAAYAYTVNTCIFLKTHYILLDFVLYAAAASAIGLCVISFGIDASSPHKIPVIIGYALLGFHCTFFDAIQWLNSFTV